MFKNLLSGLTASFKTNRTRFILLAASALSTLACAIASYLHYTKQYYNSPMAWIGWIAGMLLLLLAVFPRLRISKETLLSSRNTSALLLLGLLLPLFLVSHLWNFGTAPWNQNGMFDDAAWDIHFSKSMLFGPQPFQAAFFSVSSAKEVVFHYYLIPFFKVLGYSILTYDIALLVLGFITVFFTALLVHRLFNNYIITVISAVVFNFLPEYFIQTFVGHRYAIVPPLIMASMYLLYTGFIYKSPFRIALSSVLGGLCFTSAIMGKQYYMALAGALILYLLFDFKRSFTRANWNHAKLFVFGTLVSCMPMLFYILYNQHDYFFNEGGYTKLLFETVKNDGMPGFMTYFTRMTDCLFGETDAKWFIPQFPIIPISYYLLLVPGMVIAFVRKHYSYIPLVLIAPLGAFIAGFSDYRVLHSSPLWVILMAFTLNEILLLKRKLRIKGLPRALKNINYRLAGLVLAALAVLAGLIPGMEYIYKKSGDPYSIWLFAQKDVAVSRYLRDIVAGVPNPSTAMRRDEFNKLPGLEEPDYDTFICQKYGYAITHLFLQDYDSKKILSFSNQLPFEFHLSESEILDANKAAIAEYRKSTRDLKLVWEISEKTNRIIGMFKKLNYLGSDEVLTSGHAGQEFSLYILNIKNENIEALKQKVMDLAM